MRDTLNKKFVKSLSLVSNANNTEKEKSRTFAFELSSELSCKCYKISNNDSLLLQIVLESLVFGFLSLYLDGDDNLRLIVPTNDGQNLCCLNGRVNQNMNLKDILMYIKSERENMQKNDNIYQELYWKFSNNCGKVLLKDLYASEDVSGDFSIVFYRMESIISAKVIYDMNTFEFDLVQNFVELFIVYAHQMLTDYTKVLTDIVFPSVQLQGLEDKTISTYATIFQAFEEQCYANPDRIAIIYNEISYTYRQCLRHIELTTHNLLNMGIRKGDIVGVSIYDIYQASIYMFAIFRIGAIYMPVNFNGPQERIQSLLKKHEVRFVLQEDMLYDASGWPSAHGVSILSMQYEKGLGSEFTNNRSTVRNEDLAYIINTSGTTGAFKSVAISHGNLVNSILWRSKEYGLLDRHVCIQLFSGLFDGFFTSFLTPLISGSTVVLLKEEHRINPIKIIETIKRYKITHILATPSLMEAIIAMDSKQDLYSLQQITLAGEKISHNLVKSLKELNNSGLEISNEYGLTECAIVCLCKRNIQENNYFSVGTPISNTMAIVSGRNGNALPVGFFGELCISGTGVFKGYLGDHDATQNSLLNIDGQIFYRTGDIARILPNYEIEFLGRKDNQIKIRGFRISLDEIEECLSSIEQVCAAHVFLDPMDSQSLLAFVSIGNNVITEDELREIAKTQLYDYQMPTQILILNEIPVNSSGKADKDELLKLLTQSARPIVVSITETQRKLLNIWTQILARTNISIDDNFFEVGGHSLKATMLLSRILKEFNVKIDLLQIYRTPTIKELSYFIDRAIGDYDYIIEKTIYGEGGYELSSNQESMYISSRLRNISTSYNVPFVFYFKKRVDVQKLKDAISAIIDRHEILRTEFVLHDGKLLQHIKPFAALQWTITEHDCIQTELNPYITTRIKEFDLGVWPLFRTELIHVDGAQDVLFMDMHHIITDGLSISVFIKELQRLYSGENLRALPYQYRDYAVWQKKFTKSKSFKNQAQYWNLVYQDMPKTNILPYDYKKSQATSFAGDYVDAKLDFEISNKITKFIKNQRLSKFTFFLSVYLIFLNIVTEETDLTVGIPAAGRPQDDLYSNIGMFVNTLAFRSQINRQNSFVDIAKQLSERLKEALSNQLYPYENLINDIRKRLKGIYHKFSLFDTMFTMDEFDFLKQRDNTDLEMEFESVSQALSKFDISVNIEEKQKGYIIRFDYQTDLFKKQTINKFLSTYIDLVEYVIEQPKTSLSHYCCQSLEETIVHTFQERVRSYPEKIIIRELHTTLTYREVDQITNEMALQMRGLGVSSGNVVALLMHRSANMILTILSILKAGAAFMPIHIQTPIERIEYMLSNVEAPLLVFDSAMEHVANSIGKIRKVAISDILHRKRVTQERLVLNLCQEDLAYVMYTSGSTGIPKGVMVTHKSLHHLLSQLQFMFPSSIQGRFLFKTSYAFDVSLTEIFSFIYGNYELVILQQGEERNPSAIAACICQSNITHLNFVPTMFDVFTASLSDKEFGWINEHVQYVFLAGERANMESILEFHAKAPSVKIINLYGPTECTVYVTAYELNFQEQDDVPIGWPLKEVKVRVTDDNLQDVLQGESGELLVGGICLAAGYSKNRKETEKRFIEQYGEIWYRTGDIVFSEKNGLLHYCGRNDRQIKLRGHRVECAEIETVLRKHNKILSAVVQLEQTQEKSNVFDELVAYLIVKDANNFNVKEIRAHLLRSLPEYMMPSAFVILDQFPELSSGKIDYQQLTRLYEDNQLYLQNNQDEKSIYAKVVCDVFHDFLKKDVSIFDNYFDIGGNSLNAVLLTNKLNEEFGIDLTLEDFFEANDISQICNLIEEKVKKIQMVSELLDQKKFTE